MTEVSNHCVACQTHSANLTQLTYDKTTIKICSLDCLHIFLTATDYGQKPQIKHKKLKHYPKIDTSNL